MLHLPTKISDWFGWGGNELSSPRSEWYIPFVHQVVRLVAAIASANVPDRDPRTGKPNRALQNFLQTKCGGSQVGGGVRRATCFTPRQPGYRASSDKLAVRSPEAWRAAEALAPLQLGMAKCSADAYLHSLRALWGRRNLCA